MAALRTYLDDSNVNPTGLWYVHDADDETVFCKVYVTDCGPNATTSLWAMRGPVMLRKLPHPSLRYTLRPLGYAVDFARVYAALRVVQVETFGPVADWRDAAYAAACGFDVRRIPLHY